jgi:formate/nitrite transporter
LPYGITRLAGGLSFCLGLILVIVGGAELFTGNALIVMAAASGKVSLGRLLRNWALVYAGNFAGALATAAVVLASGQHAFGGGAVGANALRIAAAKCGLGFGQAVALGVLCNVLVCLAVWLTLGARSVADKILAIVFPIAAFVALGFEHSIANMYFIPLGLGIKAWADPSFWSAAGLSPGDVPKLTLEAFLVANLIPVTLGNIVGGAGMVGLVYWFVYLRPAKTPSAGGT